MLLDGPAGLFGGRSPALTPFKDAGGALPARTGQYFGRLAWAPFSVFSLSAALDRTARLSRKRRKKNEEFADVLTQLASTNDESNSETGQCSEDSNRHLQLVAHMLGEVVLAGSGFDVQLKGGRFSGITRQGKALMPLIPARSFLRSGGAPMSYRTVSSFSFESDHGTGLREELRIDDKEGTLARIEYSFRDNSPLLSIVVEIRFPDLPPFAQVEEYAPLALALRQLKKGETATIETAAPDGSASSLQVSEETASTLAPGATHRIRRFDGGWIILHFGEADSPSWALPSFRVIRLRGARILEVNPFGNYTPQPARFLSGQYARYSLRLGLEDTQG
jgi:hypothetical protein